MVLLAACGGSKQGSPSSGGSGAGGDGSGESTGSGSDETSAGGEAASGETPAAAAEPMEADLPDAANAKPFPRRFECAAKGCNVPHLVPDTLKAQLDKDAPIFLYEIVMPAKVMMMMPKHAGLDLYGVLFDGEVSVMADDIKEKGGRRAWKLNGFRAPGAGVNIYSKEPTRIIMAVIVNGTSGSVADEIDKLEKKDKTIAWSKRATPVTAFELLQKPDVAWGGGAYHARLAIESDAPASLSWLMMSKNASVAQHTHDKEWEFLAILEGEGELIRKSGGKASINGATFASIKPGDPHGFHAAGTKPTWAIQYYWPPGPEQRFKKLAEGGK
jgi:mannose-6-phosphate isomerase-like protein (cupin superfamily)